MRSIFLVLVALGAVAILATGPAAAANATTTTTAANATTTATDAELVDRVADALANRTTNTTATTTAPTTTTSDSSNASVSVTAGDGSTLANTESIQMTDSARIVGWEFSQGRVKIAIEADSLTRVTITDGGAGLEDAGSTRIPKTTRRIWGGETTIVSMPVATAFGGHVVGVSIGDSGVRLSTDMDAQGRDPLRHFGGQSGLFSGIGIAVLTSLAGAWYVLRSEENGVVEA